MSNSPASGSSTPQNRHALTAVEKQRSQLEKLLKDPAKAAYIPPPPKEKTLRPAREMMKNVQGSSAGAGSGEFHVYKASRRREYERLKLLEEESQKEIVEAEFEQKRREAEETANAKTAKNRAKRQKRKERSKMKGREQDDCAETSRNEGQTSDAADIPIKKRRLVNGKELVFRKPGEASDEDEMPEDEYRPQESQEHGPTLLSIEETPAVLETPRITITEDD